jgi:hypothetical protein
VSGFLQFLVEKVEVVGVGLAKHGLVLEEIRKEFMVWGCFTHNRA